jgi:hypothetical protein
MSGPPPLQAESPLQQQDPLENPEDSLANYKFVKGANWDSSENVRTLLQWIHISAIYLDVLIEAATHYRRVIRRHTVLNLILSTLASTVSLSQFNLNEASHPELSLVLKILFSVSSVIIALSAGFVKVYQIQDKLEKSLQLQQEWTTFGSKITSEMQLPVPLRKDALYMLVKMKETYANLVKQQVNVSKRIVRRVAAANGVKAEDLSLSDLFERILKGEAQRIAIQFDSVAGIDEEVSQDPDAPAEPQSVLKSFLKRNKTKIVCNEDRCKISSAIMSPAGGASSSYSAASASAYRRQDGGAPDTASVYSQSSDGTFVPQHRRQQAGEVSTVQLETPRAPNSSPSSTKPPSPAAEPHQTIKAENPSPSTPTPLREYVKQFMQKQNGPPLSHLQQQQLILFKN